DGHVRSADGKIDFDVNVPKELGGPGRGTDPEQLFAAGYAACFHSALRAVAHKTKMADVSGSTVTARVGLGPEKPQGYGMAVTLKVELPGVESSVASQLIDAAHQFCPYSRATHGNIPFKVEL